jgi:hypothetical protein
MTSKQSLQLFAPETYPTKPTEIRAYTIAAFRVAQTSNQLSLVAMQKSIVGFLVKGTSTPILEGKNMAYGRLRWISPIRAWFSDLPIGSCATTGHTQHYRSQCRLLGTAIPAKQRTTANC